MANPEYEAKVNPADLYNDEILEQFEAIRNVIHKEILPSTYNELTVTSNQAGVFNNWYDLTFYPSTELIFPLSPQSGNINWLEKNFLRFKLTIEDTNYFGAKLLDFPIVQTMLKQTNGSAKTDIPSNYDLYKETSLCIIDGASIFKSIELNYGGTAIWTSAYQQVESFFTFSNIPDQLTSVSPQYATVNKTYSNYISNYTTFSAKISYSANNAATGRPAGTEDDREGSKLFTSNDAVYYSLLIDIDISRISPILSWLSLIPGFINKLTLRVVLDAPANYLVYKYGDFEYHHFVQTTTKALDKYNVTNLAKGNPSVTGYGNLPKDGIKFYPGSANAKEFYYSNLKWKMELCEIHQCNATMTEDTRIRLISLIQQMGGKWIYPCRYWNTTISPIQTISNTTTQTIVSNVEHQFILTGCYFRSLSFTNIINDVSLLGVEKAKYKVKTPGQGLFDFPNIKNLKIYCDSELIASYNSIAEVMTDTDSALIDNDKYTISRDVVNSLLSSLANDDNNDYGGFHRDCLNKALGPPNGLYSGKYTSEKMGTHNIVIQVTFSQPASASYQFNAWLGALIDGVIVFDGFNGNYFTTGRKMQQVYEALS